MDGKERISHKIILRSNAKFEKGVPPGYYGKYLFRMGERLQVGSTIAPGGISAHLRVGEVDLGGGVTLKNGVIGDYCIRLGQGILGWNSFSMSGSGAPSSLLRRGTGLVPYSATSPEEVCRGIGVTLGFGPMVEGTFFYSQQRESLVGGSAAVEGERYRIGLNLLAARGVEWCGGAGLDAIWSIGRYRLFGEGALDKEGDGALILGAVLPINGDFECSAAARWYSPTYYADYSGGLSSTSACKNQFGFIYNSVWTPYAELELRSVVDIVYYPAPRYGVKVPSFEVESSVEGEWSRGDHHLNCRWRYRYYGHQSRHKRGVRLDYHFRPGSGFYGGVRGEVVWDNIYKGTLSPGVAFYVECGYLPVGKKWECAVRGTVYHIDSWDNRIYFYERDLPQSFSVPALYRRGWDLYGYIKYAPLSRAGLYLKVSTKMIKGQITLTF